jgi:CheY-like chemotaxis protein
VLQSEGFQVLSIDSQQLEHSTPLVLLVEDNKETCLLLARALSLGGYRVRTACDGQEALDSLADEPPQLVIIDLWMPRLDGITLIELVQQREVPFPILAISASAPSPDLTEVPFLHKPFAIAQFLDTVGRLLPVASASTPSSVVSSRS